MAIKYLNLPRILNEKISVGMEERDFKDKHRKAQNCIMSKDMNLYYIIYRETGQTFLRFYYFETGVLTFADDGDKARNMGIDCEIIAPDFD